MTSCGKDYRLIPDRVQNFMVGQCRGTGCGVHPAFSPVDNGAGGILICVKYTTCPHLVITLRMYGTFNSMIPSTSLCFGASALECVCVCGQAHAYTVSRVLAERRRVWCSECVVFSVISGSLIILSLRYVTDASQPHGFDDPNNID